MHILTEPYCSELVAYTTEFAALRQRALSAKLGAETLEAAEISQAAFDALSDEEQELYLEQEEQRGEDEDFAEHLEHSPEVRLELERAEFLGDVILFFAGVYGYVVEDVEPGKLTLVSTPVDSDYDSATFLELAIINANATLSKKRRLFSSDNHPDGEYLTESLTVEPRDQQIALAGLQRLASVNRRLETLIA